MLSLDVLTFDMLSLDTWPLTCYHLTPTCYYLSSNMIYLTYNYHFMGMLTWSPDSTHVHLILQTCSCIFLLFDNYLINHKKRTYIGSENLTDINIYSCLQWYYVFCATKSSGSTWGPSENRGECWLSTSWCHPERASYKTLMYALQLASYTSNGTSSIMVLSMHETHYKYCSLIPLLVSNNSLALLKCDVCVLGRYNTYLDIWVRRVIRINMKDGNKWFIHA